ncbi:hotdog family protein [Vibrio hippocampi]|uniref:3-hydroxydecanoyl-ACP dehydratase n=1 Tax=Vibrio hippocampi TaxID=654686 RepID=A0ABM8ZMY1_9VIBR|nr:hotdog family protein [Vibrio hippocampi]CAH0529159.1 hypothetical protein VHP8226_03080 [Vibrio hippocampi]
MSNYPAIEQLVPHNRPMILVDRALQITADTIHCQVDIGEHNPFFDHQTQSIPAYVGIEFMAQTVAAWSGYHSLQQGSEPSIGFLLGGRRYTSECDVFHHGQILDIHAEKMMEDNGMAVFTSQIIWQGTQIASCQLNVYVPSDKKLQEMKIRSQQ